MREGLEEEEDESGWPDSSCSTVAGHLFETSDFEVDASAIKRVSTCIKIKKKKRLAANTTVPNKVNSHNKCLISLQKRMEGIFATIVPKVVGTPIQWYFFIHGFAFCDFSYLQSVTVWKQMIRLLTYHQKVNSS